MKKCIERQRGHREEDCSGAEISPKRSRFRNGAHFYSSGARPFCFVFGAMPKMKVIIENKKTTNLLFIHTILLFLAQEMSTASTENRIPIRSYVYLIGVFLICFHVHVARAQSPAFYTINNESGAPSNEIYRIVEDKHGYVWIGSNAGLFRFDGIEFTHYFNNAQNSRSISFLQEDAKGRIWSKNFFGQIFRTEGTKQKLVLDFQTSDPNYPQFTLDSECNIIVYDEDRIVKYTENGKKVNSVEIKGLKPQEQIVSLFTMNGRITGLTDKLRLFELDPKTLRVTKKLSASEREMKISAASSFFEHKGKLHLFVEEMEIQKKRYLYAVDANLKLTKQRDLNEITSEERAHGLKSDGTSIWAFTSKGCFRLDDSKKRLFENNRISHVMKDRSGGFWFSSLDDGLFVVPKEEVTVLNTKNSALKENHITCSKIISPTTVWLGTYSGALYKYTRTTKALEPIYPSTTESFFAVKKIDTYKNFVIVSRGRLCLVDQLTGKEYFPKFSNVRDFCFREDMIYLVFNQFIIKMPFNELFKDAPQYSVVSKDGGKEIEYDPIQDRFVISTSKGTFWLEANGTWKEIKKNGKPIFASTLCYNDNAVWIGTISNGLIGFQNGKEKYHYSTRNKLGENAILGVAVHDKYVWVNSDKYLYRICPEKNSVERCGKNCCINALDIVHMEADGELLVLASNKAVITMPTTIDLMNSAIPRLLIEGIESNGEAVTMKNDVRLTSDNTNVKIFFSSCLISNRGDYTVEYQLKGLSDNWEVVNKTSKYVFLPNIPSGDYVLTLRLRDPYGKITESNSLQVFVPRHYYATWWFFLLLSCAIGAVTYVLVRRRIRYIRTKAEAKSQLVQSQLTALKVQMNPHFMFNTLNSLQDLILKHDFKNTNYYLSKYASLMRLILNNSERNEIGIDEEIEMLDTYLKLEKLRFGDDFNFQLINSDELNRKNYQLPPMIIQPYVENAIKHGLMHKFGEKLLTIQFEETDLNIICTVEDNGVGREESQRINERQRKSYESFSSNATDKRLNLMSNYHQSTFNVEIVDLENDKGTKVVLTFGKEKM